VLQALGLSEAVARSSLRFGIGRSNDAEEIEWVAGRARGCGALRCVDASAPEPSAFCHSDSRLFGSCATFSPIDSTLDLTDLTPRIGPDCR